MNSNRSSGCLITAIGAWLILSSAAVAAIAVGAPPNTRAVVLMGAGLVPVRVVPGGLLPYSGGFVMRKRSR
jgi:hypothetical protein